MCGTNYKHYTRCRSCNGKPDSCDRQLDRDKDFEDLVKCPEGYMDEGFWRYPQMWPIADVFTRVCRKVPIALWRKCKPKEGTDYYGNDVRGSVTKEYTSSCRYWCKSIGAAYFTFNTHRNKCYCKHSRRRLQRRGSGLRSGGTSCDRDRGRWRL